MLVVNQLAQLITTGMVYLISLVCVGMCAYLFSSVVFRFLLARQATS